MTPNDKAAAKRFNEFLKALVATGTNAGLAVTTAASGGLYLNGPSVPLVYWAFSGLMIICVSLALFEQMRPEE